LEEAANCAWQADIYLGDAEFDMIVGAKFGEIDVVNADDFATFGVDDLLIEEILADGEPGFVGMVGIQGALGNVQIDAARGDFFDLVIARDEWLEAPAGDEVMRNTIGLVGGFEEEFAHTADELGLRVVHGGTHEFGGEEHLILSRGGEPRRFC